MTYDSLVNRGEYFSAHYLAEVFPRDLKSGLVGQWKEREEAAASSSDEREPGALPVTPRAGLRELRRAYFTSRAYFAESAVESGGDDSATYDRPEWREQAATLNASILRALGYDAKPATLTVARADHTYEVRVAHSEPGLVALDCGWSAEPDAALDPDGPGRLLNPVRLDASSHVTTGSKLASFLFAAEDAPRYVLLLVGGVVVLADRAVWGEGRYLAVSLDAALERNDTKAGGELDTVAALFGADSLRTPEEGGENPLASLVDKSTKHAVGVSSDLRDGLRLSVELIANEILDRVRSHDGLRPEDLAELPDLSRQLTSESLRYLYRVLFLLYAEARPELGILPSDYPEYHQGYGLGRLGELVADRDLVGEKAREGFYLYESLDLLFRKVQEGYRPRRTHGDASTAEKASEDIGLRFEPLHSKLFEPESIRLIGRSSLPDPRVDEDAADGPRFLDTRLRNATLYKVLRLLMLTRGRKGERGGFISYAQLGINQLGAVYEGLMSYSGFVAAEELYEVAKGGDPGDGSWLVPASKADEYADSVFVRRRDDETGADVRVRYRPGSFVYRLSGRDRQTSASYYTPEPLTKVTVRLALQHRLDQDGEVTPARELLDWKICEPALGSGAFLNEAINQVAAEYLRRRQEELGTPIGTEAYAVEFQKAKAYIALHNSYGVDLNATAVELAEVSLWLNTMHPGMEAPWFGLHLKRGNSLIGGRREVYAADKLRKSAWLGTTPERFPLTEAANGLPVTVTERKTRSGETHRQVENAVHHFLLPAKEWGAVAAEKEAKALAPTEAKALATWRRMITRTPTSKQSERLQGLARRVEYLWELVVRRLEISEREISRQVDVWGAEEGWLRAPQEAVPREKVLSDLEEVDAPYWRLKTVMDAWCALWFWPVQDVALLDGSDGRYARGAAVAKASAGSSADGVLMSWEVDDLFGGETKAGTLTRKSVNKRRTGRREGGLTGGRRPVIPLANMDDWLDFAEALLGTQDVPADSLVTSFDSLNELESYESELPGWMGMDHANQLADRFLWLEVATRIAKQQGFFHWELEFAGVFAGPGGFDLQVGNPPWVRPRWREDLVLAELQPWFMLSERPEVAEWRLRKNEALSNVEQDRLFFLRELASNVGIVSMLGNVATYPLLTGTQPDLYRAFMAQVWRNSSAAGMTGLIHPDTHMGGVKEGLLRKAAYEHLRVHGHFSNKRKLFEDVKDEKFFSINIYGQAQQPSFIHASWLYAPQTLLDSLTHDAHGPLPHLKHEGTWDIRPHRERLVHVDMSLLVAWNRLAGDSYVPDAQAALLYPVTTNEQAAIATLADWPDRLALHGPQISSGYHEKNAKDAKLIRWNTQDIDSLNKLILQGSHIHLANPMAKQPNNPCRNKDDFAAYNLSNLSGGTIQRTNYIRASSESGYQAAQDTWDGKRYTEFFRLGWRMMTPLTSERSLIPAIISPGPAHVDAVNTMRVADSRTTVLQAGFWSSLPLDYLLRVTGRERVRGNEARRMPFADPHHPLAPALLLRTLRLNCLTAAYAPLWEDLYSSQWGGYEDWAVPDWLNAAPLSAHLKPTWGYNTPLRTEHERRAALVELDGLVAVWLGITADQLVALYLSRFPKVVEREAEMYFDAGGRRLTANNFAYGHGQTKQHYLDLLDHLEDPATIPPPAGYTAPFYKADRESEMRAAHAHFQSRLDAEIAAGRWAPPEPDPAAPSRSE